MIGQGGLPVVKPTFPSTSGDYAVVGTYGSFINPIIHLTFSPYDNDILTQLLVNNENHIWYLNANNEVVSGDAVSDGNAVLTAITNSFTSFYELPDDVYFDLDGISQKEETPTIIGNLCE